MNPPEFDLISQLIARLRQPLPGETAHARFSPHPPRGGSFPRNAPANARQAAALILLYPQVKGDASSYALPLTVRHADLPDHAGQISLPGGRIDRDETAEAAALREAAEEIGVDPSSVRILGSLTPLYVLVSRFVITTFIGVAAERPDFQLAEREVAALIEVPLQQLRNRENLHWGHRTREGYLVDFPYFRLPDAGAPQGQADHQVWGATAMILGEFISLIDEDFKPTDRPH